jgi:hypothetical protein
MRARDFIVEDLTPEQWEQEFVDAYGDTAEDVWYSIKSQVLFLASDYKNFSHAAVDFLEIRDRKEFVSYVFTRFLPAVKAAGWPAKDTAELNHAIRDQAHKIWGESVNEVAIDNKNGWGAVPYNKGVDYFGVRVLMKPSTFLKLALPLDGEPSADIKKHIAGGGAIGAPFLDIAIPPEWSDGDLKPAAKISGHEGRNRMNGVLATEGDVPVEVHLFPSGGMRARHITPDMIKRMNQAMYAERSTSLVTGPLFALPAKESLNEAATAELYHSTTLPAALKIMTSGRYL